MKSFFMFFGTCGFILMVILGGALTIGIPSNSHEVVKSIELKPL